MLGCAASILRRSSALRASIALLRLAATSRSGSCACACQRDSFRNLLLMKDGLHPAAYTDCREHFGECHFKTITHEEHDGVTG